MRQNQVATAFILYILTVSIDFLQEILLEKYYEYLSVFQKESERIPLCKLWDPDIELKERFVPKELQSLVDKKLLSKAQTECRLLEAISTFPTALYQLDQDILTNRILRSEFLKKK